MKKLLLIVASVLALVSPLIAQTVPQQPKLSQQGVAPQDLLAVFPALSATGQTGAISLVSDPGLPGLVGTIKFANVYAPKFLAVQTFLTGAPIGCSYTVYGTTKLPQENPVYPADYAAISTAQTCTTAGIQFFTYVPVNGILISLTTLSGGTSPTVTFRLLSAH